MRLERVKKGGIFKKYKVVFRMGEKLGDDKFEQSFSS